MEEKLKTELALLKEELQQAKRNHEQISVSLHQELDASISRESKLKIEIDGLKQTIDQQSSANAHKLADEKAERSLIKKEMLDQMAMLQSRLDSLREFQQRKEELEEQARSDQREIHHVKQEYEEKLGEMHLRAHRLESRVEQLEKEAAEQAAAIGISEGQDADENDAMKLLQQNRKLSVLNRKLQEEISQLKEKNSKLKKEVIEAKEEAILSRELEQKALQKSTDQSVKVSDIESKLKYLEDSLRAQELTKQEGFAIQGGLQAQIATLKGDNARLERQIKHQTREVYHAREIVREVLAERSEAQAFLVSSIRCIRKHIASEQQHNTDSGKSLLKKKKTIPIPRITSPSTTSPTTDSSALSSAQSSPASSDATSSTSKSTAKSSILAAAAQVRSRLNTQHGMMADIRELTWEEREAVLRLLLATINGSKVAKLAQSLFTAGSLSRSNETESPSICEAANSSGNSCSGCILDHDGDGLIDPGHVVLVNCPGDGDDQHVLLGSPVSSI